MIVNSLGNVGMIMHCAPLLLNTGWTESRTSIYKYYYDGITQSVGRLLEEIDKERVLVSKELGLEVETTKEWLKRTYKVQGESLTNVFKITMLIRLLTPFFVKASIYF